MNQRMRDKIYFFDIPMIVACGFFFLCIAGFKLNLFISAIGASLCFCITMVFNLMFRIIRETIVLEEEDGDQKTDSKIPD